MSALFKSTLIDLIGLVLVGRFSSFWSYVVLFSILAVLLPSWIAS